jgi:hypothetical protein
VVNYVVHYVVRRDVVNDVARVDFACATAHLDLRSRPNPSHSPVVHVRGWDVEAGGGTGKIWVVK